MNKRLGKSTILFENKPVIRGFAAVAGKKEGEGPLGDSFDQIFEDTTCGEKSWEKAETHLQRSALLLACKKAGLAPQELDCVFAGDLLNQCIGSAFAVRDTGAPFLGLYGACSTMAEGLLIAGMLADGGYVKNAVAAASSHFCSAERQYRFPLAYGGQRTPTAQWTATAAGAAVVTGEKGKKGICLTHGVIGKMVDLGVKDANNMGAAMAPAAYDTLNAFWQDTKTGPEDYDMVVTGDLAQVGGDLLRTLFIKDGINVNASYSDCGILLFDKDQDAHSGGSGCGCSASVLCGHILRQMEQGKLKKVLFAGTGALMSPVSVQQGESIPGICHLVALEAEG